MKQTRTKEVQGMSCGIMVNVLDGNILVNLFELQWRYYVHFWTNWKGMSHLIPSATG